MYYIIQELFVFCISTYKASIPSSSHKVGEDKDRAKLQEEVGRLLLWGDSYAVSEGKLDILFENTKNKYLRKSTVILLYSIARTLNTYFSNINVQSPTGLYGVPISPSLRSNIIAAHINNALTIQQVPTEESIDQTCGEGSIKELLQTCNDRTKRNTESPTHEEIHKVNLSKPPTMLDLEDLLGLVQTLMPDIASLVGQESINDSRSNSDSDCGPPEFDLLEVVGDLGDSLDSLFDFIPSIDELFPIEEEEDILVEKLHEKIQLPPAEPISPIYGAATQSYRIAIRSKFPKMNDHLIETLAELNWERIERIRSRRFAEKNILTGQETKDRKSYEKILPDSVTGDSGPISQDSLGSSKTDPLLECASGAPALTPRPTTPPVRTLNPIPSNKTPAQKTRDDLASLRPYSCLFSYCPWKSITYARRDDWVAHEFEHHRPHNAFEWHCSDTCAKVFGEREEFVRHVLEDHLEGAVIESDINDIVENRKVKISKACNDRISCPFCCEVIPETKESIELHIGTHMDEIALMALSASLENKSTKSAKHESNISKNLPIPQVLNNQSSPSSQQSRPTFNAVTADTSQTLAYIPTADPLITRSTHPSSPPGMSTTFWTLNQEDNNLDPDSLSPRRTNTNILFNSPTQAGHQHISDDESYDTEFGGAEH
ncbi:hypothetical protein P167DRAFT_7216 [Morchella conica CCBAS932]|uniref:C2H2-type domain-containing protein n=1 Tax=Morchella conica CCBAS932 TaxID=1392247 RepID=A0A3N4L442_9PEZI|nr:hypothetical protein P167DRAFT_7216 [Morchella conica CCBAS932]